MPEIYQPSDDSFLMQDAIKKLKIKGNEKILDMGSGSGIQAQAFMQLGAKKENVFLADINPEAVKFLKRKFPKSKAFLSDLFSNKNFQKIKFDIIVFNPPYLPLDVREPESSRLATTGGKKGSEIINKFLVQAKSHLNKNGKIILLTSSLTKAIKWQAWKKTLIAKKKLWFEELFVWELTRG